MRIKHFIVFIILFFAFDTANCQNSIPALTDSINYAFIEFETKTVKLDSVKVGSTVHNSFEFNNTGKIPLIIKDVKSSCGCTIVAFNKKPVAPGKCGKIEFYYNAPHKPVVINKYLIVITNTYEKNYILRIKGKVVK